MKSVSFDSVSVTALLELSSLFEVLIYIRLSQVLARVPVSLKKNNGCSQFTFILELYRRLGTRAVLHWLAHSTFEFGLCIDKKLYFTLFLSTVGGNPAMEWHPIKGGGV